MGALLAIRRIITGNFNGGQPGVIGARSLYPDVPAPECALGFRPKCLICGDDILASSACCCLAACLYSLDTTRRLRVIPTGFVKTFTAFSNCSTNLAPRLRW